MKHIFGIFLALFVVGGAYAVPATVVGVIDGDSIYVRFLDDESDKQHNVRLINANAPDFPAKCRSMKQLAQQAYERAQALMPVDSVVELKNIKEDEKAKRIKANVILSDGRDVGQILINEKLAKSYDGKTHESWCSKTKWGSASSKQK